DSAENGRRRGAVADCEDASSANATAGTVADTSAAAIADTTAATEATTAANAAERVTDGARRCSPRVRSRNQRRIHRKSGMCNRYQRRSKHTRRGLGQRSLQRGQQRALSTTGVSLLDFHL